jgi:hypothetical protein
MTTTYTVRSHDGEIVATGLSLAETAAEILQTDSRAFEIRQAGDEYRVWSRQECANVGWDKTQIFSLADTREEAEREIFAEVVRASGNWRGHRQAMTTAAHRGSLARLLADLEDETPEEQARVRAIWAEELAALPAE